MDRAVLRPVLCVSLSGTRHLWHFSADTVDTLAPIVPPYQHTMQSAMVDTKVTTHQAVMCLSQHRGALFNISHSLSKHPTAGEAATVLLYNTLFYWTWYQHTGDCSVVARRQQTAPD